MALSSSRRILLLGIALAILGGGLFQSRDVLLPKDDAIAQVTKPGRVQPPPAKPLPSTITPLPVAAEAASALGAKDGSVEDDLSTIEMLLSSYGRNHGGHPTGENEEIAAALLGKNDKRVAYLEGRGSYLDASGRLIDRWGRPYIFHSITAKWTELRSTGPDGQPFTADDVVRGGDEQE